MAPPPACAEGFMPDFAFFHNPTPPAPCVPEGLLKYFFAEIAVVCAGIVVALLLRLRSAKSDARVLLISCLMSQTFVVASVLSLWLENGMFAATTIFSFLTVAALSQVGRPLLALALNPAVPLGVHRDVLINVRRFYDGFTALWLSVLGGIACAQAWASQSASAAVYNNIVLVDLAGLVVHLVVLTGGLMIHLARLSRAITLLSRSVQSTSDREDKLALFNGKVKRLEKSVVMFFCSSLPSLLALLIVFAALGYFPYSVIFVVITMNSSASVSISVLLLLREQSADKPLTNHDLHAKNALVNAPPIPTPMASISNMATAGASAM